MTNTTWRRIEYVSAQLAQTDLGQVSSATEMVPYPEWLHILAWAYLSLSFLCATIMIIDELRRPQKMMIMNFVWPITSRYGGPVALWGYFKSAPKMTKQHMEQMKEQVHSEREKAKGILPMMAQQERSDPAREQVAVGVSQLRRRLYAGGHLRRVVGFRNGADLCRW